MARIISGRGTRSANASLVRGDGDGDVGWVVGGRVVWGLGVVGVGVWGMGTMHLQILQESLWCLHRPGEGRHPATQTSCHCKPYFCNIHTVLVESQPIQYNPNLQAGLYSRFQLQPLQKTVVVSRRT